MDEEQLRSRLSRISTVWTLLEKREPQPGEQDRRAALIQRYQGAVYRYLLGATRDPDVADELFQEFALRFIQGAFHGVDRNRGRFRDYLRTVLIHLVCDHQKRQRNRPRPLDLDVSTPAVQPEQAGRGGGAIPHELARRVARSGVDEPGPGGARGGPPLLQPLAIPGGSHRCHLGRNGGLLDRPGASRTTVHGDGRSQDCCSVPAPSSPRRCWTTWPIRSATLRPMRWSEELIDLDLLPYCRDALPVARNTGREPGGVQRLSRELEKRMVPIGGQPSEPPLDLHLKLTIETTVRAR